MHHVDHRDGAIALIGQPGLDRAMLEGELRRSAGGAQALGSGVRGRDGGRGGIDAVSTRDASVGGKAGEEQPAAAADVEDIGARWDQLDAARDRRDAVTMMLQHALEKRTIGEDAARDGADVAREVTATIAREMAWGLRSGAVGR